MARRGAVEEAASAVAGEEIERIDAEAADDAETEVAVEALADEEGAIAIKKVEPEEEIDEQVIANVREDTI